MVSKPFIGGINAAELWRCTDVLATTSKAKKQQIARLSRLAIATTSKKKKDRRPRQRNYHAEIKLTNTVQFVAN